MTELVEAATGLLKLCQIYVPVEGKPVPPGTPGPVWIIELAFAIERFAGALDTVQKNNDYFFENFKKRSLVYGIQWLSSLTNQLLARWEWPSLQEADDWWGKFADAQCYTQDDQVRCSPSGYPTFLDINIVPAGNGVHRAEIAAAKGVFLKVPWGKMTIPVDHLGLLIYDLSEPGRPTKLLVILTHGTPDRMPDAFLLTDPIVPTIRADELSAMQDALTMIVSGAESDPDPMLGQQEEEIEPVQEFVTDCQPRSASSGTETATEPPQSEGTELPTKQPRSRKRNQGKAEQCLGAYIEAVGRGETPPTPSQIAMIVGCDRGTASRAIAHWEATRKELAKEAAQHRYRDAD